MEALTSQCNHAYTSYLSGSTRSYQGSGLPQTNSPWPLASLPTTPAKRRASHSPQGELQPAPVITKTDHFIGPDMQTVFSQLDMDIPKDAMVDTEIDDDTVNTQVKRRLSECPPDLLSSLKVAMVIPGINEDFCSVAIDALASVLLPAIFDHSQSDERVSSYKDIIKRNPWLIKELIRAHKSEKYHVIQRLRVFQSLPMREAWQKTPEYSPEQKIATVDSWEAKFVGNIPTILRGILRDYMEINRSKLYARVVPHVKSSGTGKSRAHDEMARSIFYIPLNLAARDTTTFPPRDPKVADWFDVNLGQQRTRDRCHAFLHTLLSTTLSRLEDICNDKAIADEIEMEPQSRLMILASKFRDKMAEGRKFEQHGEYRRNFYDDVCRDAQENDQCIPTPKSPTADLPVGERSPKHKFPVRARGSEGKAAAGQPDESNDNRLPVESRRVEKQLTIEEVAREIILLLNPEQKSDHSPQVVISWDESHSLLEPVRQPNWTTFSELRRALRTIINQPIISVFVSTSGKFHDFSPPAEYDPSFRLSHEGYEPLPPITEVGFDQFAEKVNCIKETWTLARIASTHQMAHLGRALFPTRFDKGDTGVKTSIVTFAAEKLLCRPIPHTGLELKPDESLACLAVRLGLDFKATSWLDKDAERRQVERHMRICLTAAAGFRSVVTISPSEPLLAEASWMVTDQRLGPKEAPQALLQHIDQSYLNAGDRGEVVAALLLMLARDEAIQNREQDRKPNPGGELPKGVSSEDLKYDGFAEGRIVTMLEFLDALVPPKSQPTVRRLKPHYWSKKDLKEKSLESAFTKAHIYFNHFIKVHDFKMVEREYLWRLICRGAAVICANNQRGVDIIIPVLMGTVLHPKFVTAILVQVKNDRTYTDEVSDSLFTDMDPCKVKLFTENEKPPPSRPPVLRIVLALASDKSAVKGPTFGTRSSPRIEKVVGFTAYDLWIAGVSSESFGVIPDTNTEGQYRVLLDRSRNVFNGYDMLIKRWRKRQDVIIESRRILHPGASSGDAHFQKYIDNVHLKYTIPTTGYNDQEFYVEEPTNTCGDVVMGEASTGTVSEDTEEGVMNVDNT